MPKESTPKAAILNTGDGAWVFEEHAQRLARAMHLGVSSSPADYNYVLGWEGRQAPGGKSFIPYDSILLVSDKRRLAEVFEKHQVAIPRTYLLETAEEVHHLVKVESQNQWVLKWPTGCGASGHRLQELGAPIPQDWPRPYLLQEFIHLEVPEVYRLYGVAGETFGWNVRRFPPGTKSSPWVAHAQGARYEEADNVPAEAEQQTRQALAATGLLDSFGCADLIRDNAGRWLVLEVNTDGVFNHVDRDISLPGLAEEIDRRLTEAFWARVNVKSW